MTFDKTVSINPIREHASPSIPIYLELVNSYSAYLILVLSSVVRVQVHVVEVGSPSWRKSLRTWRRGVVGRLGKLPSAQAAAEEAVVVKVGHPPPSTETAVRPAAAAAALLVLLLELLRKEEPGSLEHAIIS